MSVKPYSHIICGSGIYGSTIAQQLTEQGKKVLVIDKRNHIGGNCFTKLEHGIPVHVYGGHVFHTSSDSIYNYITRFCSLNNFRCSVKVNYLGKIYSFPISLFTLNQVYGDACTTPQEAHTQLAKVRVANSAPSNLEEWCLSEIGPELYEIFVKGYTEKQWGRPCSQLPASIIKRLPIRTNMDTTYFHNAKYEGVPVGGYTPMFEKMLAGVEVQLNTDFLTERKTLEKLTDKIIYSGPIDEFFGYSEGVLEYRSLRFDNHVFDGDYQGNHTINYTHKDVPYTRVHEHKYFDMQPNNPKTVVSFEYPDDWVVGKERYYPITTDKNKELVAKYKEMIPSKYVFGGRLGSYQYYDIDQTIGQALKDVKLLI
jgi:UDP-galactopyranose mutase